jgi:hypothetical protein
MFWNALYLKRVLTELPTQEADKEAIEVNAHGRGSVDDAGALVEQVSSVKAHLGLAVQALGGVRGEHQGAFDVLEWDIVSERVTVNWGRHRWSLTLENRLSI